MTNSKLAQRILKQLDAIRQDVLELERDAELGRTAREMFLASAQLGPRKEPQRRKRKPAAHVKKNGHRNGVAKSPDLGKKILELVQSRKTGIGAKDISTTLKAKPHSVAYQLDKLRAAKLLRTEGKTRHTVYLPAAAQA